MRAQIIRICSVSALMAMLAASAASAASQRTRDQIESGSIIGEEIWERYVMSAQPTSNAQPPAAFCANQDSKGNGSFSSGCAQKARKHLSNTARQSLEAANSDGYLLADATASITGGQASERTQSARSPRSQGTAVNVTSQITPPADGSGSGTGFTGFNQSAPAAEKTMRQVDRGLNQQ